MKKHTLHDKKIKGVSVLKERLIGSCMIVSSVTLTGSLYIAARPAAEQAVYEEQASEMLKNASSHASEVKRRLDGALKSGAEYLEARGESAESRPSGLTAESANASSTSRAGSASATANSGAPAAATANSGAPAAATANSGAPAAATANSGAPASATANSGAPASATAAGGASPAAASGSAKPYVVYLGAPSDNEIMLDTCMGKIPYYSQTDSHWKDYLYGGSDVMSEYGCGPTAMAMIISALGNAEEGVRVSPITIADWAAANDEFCKGSGSYLSIVNDSLAAYGLQTLPVEDTSAKGINRMLQEGHILVALVGPGDFTDDGHFILITDRTPEGRVTIADPDSLENTQKTWDPAVLSSQLMNSRKNGAPLWAVSIP
ncbi:MAG: C39 family peptidase [Lachnospiraceae bacterium]|jgi:cell division septation protein DedD|nr:C39 family peptidase [Lachnospiraceae bacterium]MCH4028438.1 C39 family peptidase [Lachnospiraceae bacterium]MCH4066287.1 C39 family peptidase [Lachnospiraceae bacterium]MCH4112318.1 C39 family peptidase [Lachnospiraceae bacterium]MCI1353297.1 C39 family peptidase [Lachnospiraceae bacterium]